jgi:hypothetical protein
MALCPNCHEILNFWNVKAECPYCGTNIPNFDWEGRLDEDARNAEVAWVKFRRFTGNFKSALFGNKLRVVRFICTFLPLIALVLPLANYAINYLPFVDSSQKSFTLLDFTLNTLLTLNWGSLANLCGSEVIGLPFTLILISVLLLYLAVVFGVLNFIFILIKAPSLKATANIVLCVLSDICFILPAIFFTIATSKIGETTAVFISGNVQFGIFVGIALFSLNVILNVIVNKTFKKQRKEQQSEE